MIDATDSETQEGLKTGDIIADAVGFMLAGYETTSTVLAFTTYLLAANPEAQERLANEIHEYFEENPVSGRHYAYLTILAYLGQSIVSHVLHFCDKRWEIGTFSTDFKLGYILDTRRYITTYI